MKIKSLLVGSLVVLASANIYAANICKFVEGNWQGQLIYKQPTECAINKGCRHDFKATVSRIHDTHHYQINLHLLDGTEHRNKIIEGKCKDNQFEIKTIAAHNIRMDCPSAQTCVVQYDDPRKQAMLVRN